MKKVLALLFLFSTFSLSAGQLVLCKDGTANCRCPGVGLGLKAESFYLYNMNKDHKKKRFKNEDLVISCHKKSLFPQSTALRDSLGIQPLVVPTIPSLEKNLAPSCDCDEIGEVPNNDWQQALVDICDTFPAACGYEWKKFDVKAFKNTHKEFLATDKILCTKSMCTSATFLAFVGLLKKMKTAGKITEAQYLEWSAFPSKNWTYINNLARPDEMMTALGIGEGKTVEKANIPDENWPKKGDMMQIWRTNESGHSTIFLDYLRDKDDKKIGYCYWTSQPGTNGYGKQCESFNDITHIHVGRVTL